MSQGITRDNLRNARSVAFLTFIYEIFLRLLAYEIYFVNT